MALTRRAGHHTPLPQGPLALPEAPEVSAQGTHLPYLPIGRWRARKAVTEVPAAALLPGLPEQLVPPGPAEMAEL